MSTVVSFVHSPEWMQEQSILLIAAIALVAILIVSDVNLK